MDVIKQWINESDVYLLILGGRYGSIEIKSGKSYTQLEYEYAVEKGKPLFACVLKQSALEARVKQHGMKMIDENSKELTLFRNLAQSKIVEFWEDSKDIKLAIINKLAHLARREDLIGWVRASQEANLPALSNEIARLSKENADLRSQLESKSEAHINGLTYSEIKTLLQSKGLWNFVKDNSGRLQQGVDRRVLGEVELLAQMGFMTRREPGYEIFILTDAGRTLLNKIEVEELRSAALP